MLLYHRLIFELRRRSFLNFDDFFLDFNPIGTLKHLNERFIDLSNFLELIELLLVVIWEVLYNLLDGPNILCLSLHIFV